MLEPASATSELEKKNENVESYLCSERKSLQRFCSWLRLTCASTVYLNHSRTCKYLSALQLGKSEVLTIKEPYFSYKIAVTQRVRDVRTARAQHWYDAFIGVSLTIKAGQECGQAGDWLKLIFTV